MLNIKLLIDRVLIKSPEEIKTSSGLIVSKENDTSGLKQGVVVAAGEGKRSDNGVITCLTVKVGDEVMFSYGEQIVISKEKYFLVRESDIAMIINVDKGAQK